MMELKKPVWAHDWRDSTYFGTYITFKHGGAGLLWTPEWVNPDLSILIDMANPPLGYVYDVHATINRPDAPPGHNAKWRKVCPASNLNLYLRFGNEPHEYLSGMDHTFMGRNYADTDGKPCPAPRYIAVVEDAFHRILNWFIINKMDETPRLFIPDPIPEDAR